MLFTRCSEIQLSLAHCRRSTCNASLLILCACSYNTKPSALPRVKSLESRPSQRGEHSRAVYSASASNSRHPSMVDRMDTQHILTPGVLQQLRNSLFLFNLDACSTRLHSPSRLERVTSKGHARGCRGLGSAAARYLRFPTTSPQHCFAFESLRYHFTSQS